MPIDYTLYPANWKAIRARILFRAGEWRSGCHPSGEIITEARCEWCHAENHQPHPRTGSFVVLTVAHLDHDKLNHSVMDDRLAALCQACHLGHDLEHHLHKRRMSRHGYGHPAQMVFPEALS